MVCRNERKKVEGLEPYFFGSSNCCWFRIKSYVRFHTAYLLAWLRVKNPEKKAKTALHILRISSTSSCTIIPRCDPRLHHQPMCYAWTSNVLISPVHIHTCLLYKMQTGNELRRMAFLSVFSSSWNKQNLSFADEYRRFQACVKGGINGGTLIFNIKNVRSVSIVYLRHPACH